MSLPLVSIVTPTLNRCAFLEAAIASVADQTYPHVEHIVVDGASADGTLELLERYRSSKRLRWLSEPDGGMYEAVNKGLQLANGEVVAYLNSDDRYMPWTVECAVEALLRTGADIAYGDLVTWRPDAGRVGLAVYGPFSNRYLRRFGTLAQPTVFLRSELIVKLGTFDETLQYVADCDYWLRASASKVVRVTEVLAVECDHPAAKRMTDATQLEAELAGVRERYRPPASRLRDLAARTYVSVGRRISIARLLAAALRVRRGGSGGPWGRFASSGFGASTSAPNLLGSLLPVVGKHFLERCLNSALTRPLDELRRPRMYRRDSPSSSRQKAA